MVVFRIVGGIGVGVASVIAPAYIAETSPPRIRGRLGLAAAAGDRVRHLLVASRSTTCCSASPVAPTKTLWLGLEAWRWMFLVMAMPAIALRRAGVHHSRSHRAIWLPATRFRKPAGCSPCCSGEKNLEITITRIRETLEREDKPSWKDLTQADRRHLRHRVGRPRAVDLPAVRRHQRDLLLLQRAVAGGRLQRRRVGRSTR